MLKKGHFVDHADKIGSVGYCFGGGWSYQTAVQGGKDVQACVMFYGMPDTSPGAIGALKAPVLMIWAKQDQWINQQVVDGFKTAMDTAHKSLEVIPYDAGHGFANPSAPSYNETAAKDARVHELEFLKKHLG
jgi:carboxymethylenebutenolidase